MKLLFDENLSSRLPARVADTFPDSDHVLALGLGNSTDDAIWRHAGQHGFSIVSKDSDFRALSVLRGAPPKVILLSVGNAGTREIEELLIATADIIREFDQNPDEHMLILRA